MVTDTQVKTGYKQTDIGVVPEDWGLYQTNEITENVSNSIKIGPFGSQLKKELLVKSGYKVYGQENVYERDVEIGERYIDENYFRKLKSCELKPGDFVISMMGTIGKCMVMPENMENGIMDSHLLRMKLGRNKINTQLLIQLFSSPVVQNQVMNLSVGGIMSGLSSTIIKKLIFPVPKNIEEQNSIAKVLHDTDKFITKLNQLIEKKRNIKQGTMQELLTGKSRLPGFSGTWEEINLGEICGKITTGKLDANAMVENGEYRFYTCAKEYYFIDHYAFDDEALLVSGNGANVGYIHYYKGKFNAYQRTYVLTDFKSNIHYVKVYMDVYLRDRIQKEVNAGNTPYIKMDTLTNMKIKLPPTKDEQAAIANVLDNMDQELELLENQKNKYLDMKQGMMQQLLTGRIRLV